MSFEWFVALRYLREGRMQTALILAGVSVGVGVIVFLSALINGLQDNLIRKTLGSQAHLVLHPPDDVPRLLPGEEGSAVSVRLEKPAQRLHSINEWQQVMALCQTVPGVVAVSPTVTGAAFASVGADSRSVILRGIEPERFNRIVDIAAGMVSGEFLVSGRGAVLGRQLARDLGLSAGEKLRLLTGNGRSDVFTVNGIFDLQNKEVNERWVLISLPAAQTLLDLPGGISSLEAKVDRIFTAERTARRLAELTGLEAESWMTLNAQLLAGLRSQSNSRYMIQVFVVVAVALGIASVLVVWVVQKRREIGILRATGTSTGRIMRVFLIQGGVLGFGGSILGSLLGSGLALFFMRVATNPDGTPSFPVDLNPRLFAGVAALATLTGLLASVAPARRAAALDPAAVIHHG